MSTFFDLFRFLVVPMNDGDFHAVVRTIFQNDDGTTEHSDNYNAEFGFPTLVNADQIGMFNYRGNIMITKTGPGEFEVEFAGPEQTVERCHCCGWLYFESTDYRDTRLSRRGYDPTDYECGCTWAVFEAKVVAEWGDPLPYPDEPVRDNNCDLYRELDAAVTEAVHRQDWIS